MSLKLQFHCINLNCIGRSVYTIYNGHFFTLILKTNSISTDFNNNPLLFTDLMRYLRHFIEKKIKNKTPHMRPSINN